MQRIVEIIRSFVWFLFIQPGIDAVLKVQKPANDWEFYVCTAVQQRIPRQLTSAFMAIPRNYVFQDGGVFVSYHQKLGTLLDIINIVKKCQGNKFSIEPMAVFFTVELLGMIDALHTVGIIHGDLKADNLLLQVGQSYIRSRNIYSFL